MAYKVSRSEWSRIWEGVREVSSLFDCRVVFIGGIAVYLHSVAGGADKNSPFVEFSHDADFYISMSDLGDLRDIEEVTPNRRLSKYQFIKNGIDFDVYVERQSGLRVPWSEIAQHSVLIDGIRAASLEHLLVLKLDAYADRGASAKGRKDERDVARIVYLLSLGKPKRVLVQKYLTKADEALLQKVSKSDVFPLLVDGNLRKARQLREKFTATVTRISR